MRQLLLLTAIACFCSVFCIAKVNDKLSHKIVKQKAPADSKPYSGQSNKKTQIKIYKANNLSAPVGEIIGTTTYDLQTNNSVCRRIAAHPNGSWFYAGWTMGKDFSTGASNRGTGFNLYDNETGTWLSQPDFRIEPSTRAGWPTIGFNQGRQFSITHSGSQGMLFTWREGNGIENNWNEVYVGELVNDYNGVWARAVTEGSNIYTIIGRPFDSEPFGNLNGGLNFIRSLDNGDTWESMGSLENDYSNSIPGRVYADSYAIDAANGSISVVYGEGISEIILYKSFDRGESWTKKTVQNNSNPLVQNLDPYFNYGEGNFTVEPFFGSNGANTVIIDSNGKTHIVFSGFLAYNTSNNDFNNEQTYFVDERACGLFYWNEDMLSPEIISKTILNDANADGKLGSNLLALLNGGRLFYSGLICQPQLGIDNEDNLYVSYTAIADGDYVPSEVSFLSSEDEGGELLTYTQNFEENTITYTDVFMIKSMDSGNSWQGPLNVTNAPLSEETYASIPRNIGDTILLIYQHDLLPGTLLQEPQQLATINEIAAVKILPDDINDSVAPPDSEPYFTAPNLLQEGTHFFLPQGCSLINEEYLDAFAFGMDYPDGIIKEFQIAGLADYNTPGIYTEGIFVEDSQGNKSDTAYYNIEVLLDMEPPVIDFENCNTINVVVGQSYTLPSPVITDYFIFENELDETGCDISESLEITHNIDNETIGTYTATYTVNDFAGNSTNTNLTVIVVESDVEGPVITVTGMPESLNIAQLDILDNVEFFAVDNFDCQEVEVTVAGLEELKNANTGGNYIVTFTSEDLNGNETIETYTVELIDLSSSNNFCENAIFIELSPTGNCTFFEIDLTNNNDDINTNRCFNEPDWDDGVDIYYKLVVPEHGQIRITASNDVKAIFYEDCTGAALQCGFVNNFQNRGFLFRDLPPGDTLILEIAKDYADIFDLCIENASPVVNDVCENASPLELLEENCLYSGYETTIENFNYNNLNKSSSCEINEDAKDFFYEFVAPPSGYIKIKLNRYFVAAIYDACSDSEISCNDGSDEIVLGKLNSGATHILQIFLFSASNDIDFPFCVSEALPTENNECENATFIEVVEPQSCGEDVIQLDFSNNSFDFKAGNTCGKADMFYKFIVPEDSMVRIGGVGIPFQIAPIANFYESCQSEPLFEVLCGFPANGIYSGFNPDDTIILQLSATVPLYNEYQFCLERSIPTSNNDCTNAAFVKVLPLGSDLNSSINHYNNTLNITSECSGGSIADSFYEFIVPSSGEIKLISSKNFYSISLFHKCEQDPFFEDCTRDSEVIISDLNTGDTLILQIQSAIVELEYEFGIQKIEPTKNNTCSEATLIEVVSPELCNENSVSIDFTYNSADLESSCFLTEADAYYEFIVPESGRIIVDFNNYYYVPFALYNACDGEEIYCATYTNDIIDLTPNDTIILKISSSYFYGNSLSFCLKNAIPTLNNTCDNATTIDVGYNNNCNSISIDFIYNDFNKSNSCTYPGSSGVDAFFEYTVPASGLVKITSERSGLSFTGYSACDSQEIFCYNDNFNRVLPYAEPGANIVLQVSYFNNSEINFCIEEAIPTANNACENAQWIDIYPDANCLETIILDLENNSLNTRVECYNNATSDAFYKFVVPPSGQIAMENPSYYADFSIQLFDNCLSEAVYCNNDLDEYEFIDDLTPGDTLILQFNTRFSRVFEFCIYEAVPSVNNNCIDAITATVGTEEDCLINSIPVNFAFNSLDLSTDCVSYGLDAFFEFVSPPSGYVKVSGDFSLNNFRHFVHISSNCNPDSFECLPELRNDVLPYIEPGTTSILQFIAPGEIVDFCLIEAEPTANNLCENASEILLNDPGICTDEITINFSENTLDYYPVCSYFYSSQVDAFYKFVVPSSGQIKLNTTYDFGLTLYTKCRAYSLYCTNRNIDDYFIPNLPVGDTLIMQIYQDYQSEISFCIEEVPCENNSNMAELPFVEISNIENCQPISESLTNETNSLNLIPDCDFGTLYNKLYRFIVPESGQVNIDPGYPYTGIALYETCSYISIYCEDYYVSDDILRNFVAGDTLILQVFNDELADFDLCIYDAPASENDLCINPQNINVALTGECNTQQIEANATNNTIDLNECGSYTDIFFEFAAPQNGYVRIQLSQNAYFSVLSSCEDEPIYCNNDNGSETVIQKLISGQNYIIRVADRNLSTFTLCLEEVEPTENNLCVNAQLVEVISSVDLCSSNLISLDLSNNSLENNISCEFGEIADAYYTFTAPPSGQVVLNNFNEAAAVYDNCGGEELYCRDYNFSENPVRNLIPDENYILQIASRNYENYEFCISDAPASINNLCENALALNIGNEDECVINEVEIYAFYNSSDYINNGCIFNKDAFFSFSAPESGSVKFTTNNSVSFALLEGCVTEYITCLQGEQTFVVTDLTPAETYILVVSDNFVNNLSICATVPDLSDNNTCENATFIQVGIESSCEENQIYVKNKDNSLDKDQNCAFDAIADAFFKFVVPPSGRIMISIDSESNSDLVIFEECDNSSSIIHCGNNYYYGYYGSSINDIIRNLPIGDTLILQMLQEQPSNFYICVEEVLIPENNTCENAEWLPNEEQETCNIAQLSIEPYLYTSQWPDQYDVCYNTYHVDAFYKMIVPKNGILNIESNQNFDIAIYENCNTEYIYCGSYQTEYRYNNLPTGDTIILQILDNLNTDAFDICISTLMPSPNNTCNVATLVEVYNEFDCQETSSTPVDLSENTLDFTPDCSFSGVIADAFYEFVVPASGKINILRYDLYSYYDFGVAIYDVCDGYSFYCNRDYNSGYDLINGLPPNETLILQIFDYNGEDFNICLQVLNPSENNTCENAMPVIVGTEEECFANQITINATYNDQNFANECYLGKDAYYSFTVPSSGYIRVDASYGIESYAVLDACYNQIICDYVNNPQFITSYLIPGSNYILQFADVSNEFTLCLSETTLADNNNCSDALMIDVATPGNCLNTNAQLSNANLERNPACEFYAVADVYFQFTAPESGAVKINANNSIGVAIYDICDGSTLFCEDNLNSADLIRDLIPNNIYILQLYNEVLNDIEFCIEDAKPTVNNTCENATLIELNQSNICPLFSIFGDISNNSLDQSLQCDYNFTSSNDKDIFYKFVVPENGIFKIDASGLDAIALYESCSSEPFYCQSSYNLNQEIVTASPGDTVICQLIGDRFNSLFSLCIEEYEGTINDNCTEAAWININDPSTCSVNSTMGNLFELDGELLCDSYTLTYERTTFFKFITPESGNININISGGINYVLYQNCEESGFFCGYNNLEVLNLNPNDTIIIQLLSSSSARTFTLCIEETNEPVNNTCNADIPFVHVNQSSGCDTVTNINLNYYNLSEAINCESSLDARDAYYKIIVPSSGKFKFDRLNFFLEYDVELLNLCSGEVLWCESDVNNSITENAFTPGDTLIARFISTNINFFVCIEDAQPSSNNMCSNAEWIEVVEIRGCNEEKTAIVNLEYNTFNPVGLCDTVSNANAFYKFIVPDNGSVLLSNEASGYAALYKTCNDANALQCKIQDIGILFQDLTQGDTLILEITGSNNSSPFQLCVSEVEIAPNNLCEFAVNLPVIDINNCSANLISQGLSFNSLENTPECANYAASDVYFSFVAPEDGSVRLLLENSPFFLGVAVYQSCSAATPIYCNSYDNRFNINDLPPGDTLILQIFNSELLTSFDICLSDNIMLNNDNCEQATNLNIYNFNECENNLIVRDFDDYNFTKEISCGFNNNSPDAFFQFVAPLSGIVQMIFSTTLSAAIYDSCSGEEVFCDNSARNEVIRNLSPGDTLILQIAARFSPGNFGLCLQEVDSPQNDICEQAKPTIVYPANNCVSNNFEFVPLELNSLDFTPGCLESALSDAFFQFTVPASGQVKISKGFATYASIYDACNGIELYCSSSYNSDIIKNLPPGENIILQISSDFVNNASFCIEEVPVSENNLCENALPIEVAPFDSDCTTLRYDIFPANNSLEQMPTCYEREEPLIADLFYEFQVPDNGKLSVFSNQFMGLAIYENCGETLIYCEDTINNQVIENLPPNETLTLQTFHYQSFDTYLCLSEVKPSENDLCENAELINVPLLSNSNLSLQNLQLNYNITNNTLELLPGCANANVDIYYQAVVPPSGKFFIYAPLNSYTNDKIGISIYATCGGEELYCNADANNASIENLPVGEIVILQFYQENNTNQSITVVDGESFANNNCEDARFIEIVDNDLCGDNLIMIDQAFYNLSQQTVCFDQNNFSVDVFYNLIVPENGNFRIESDYPVGIILYESCSNPIYCDPNYRNSYVFENLESNETLILQVLTQFDFTSFCVSTDQPSNNNSCENAEPVLVNQNGYCSENLLFVPNATNTNDEPTSCNNNNAEADVYYTINSPETRSILFYVQNNTGGIVGGIIYDSCNGEELDCFYNIDNVIVDSLPNNFILRLTQYSPGNFYLCVSEVSSIPVNDNCLNPIQLCGEPIYQNNERASSDDISIEADCNISRNKGLWYKFITNTSGNDFTIEIKQDNCSFNGSLPNLNAFVTNQSCTDSYESIEDCTTFLQADNQYQIMVQNPEPNTQYWLYLSSIDLNISCSFTISAFNGIQSCDIQPCQAKIGGSINAIADCDISRVEIIIKNENSDTLETLTVDEEGNYLTTNEYTCGNYTAQLNESSLPDCFISDSNPVNFIVNDDDILDGVEFVSSSCAGDFSLVKSPYQICQGELLSGIKIGLGKYNFYADDNGEIGAYLSTCDNAGIICSTNDFNFDTSMPGEHIIWVTEEKTDENGEACESEPESLNFEIIQTAEAKLMLNSTNTSSANPMNLMSFVEDNKTGYWSGPGIFSFPDLDGNVSWIFSGTALQALSPVTLYYTVSNGNCENSYALIVHIEEGKIRNPVLTNPVLSGIDSVTLNDTKSRLQIADSWSNEIQKQAGVNKGLLIYPNPSNGIFKIDCLECSTFPYQAFIYNLNGGLIENIQYKLERKSFNEAIDIRNELPGVYIVKFYYENDDFEYLKLIKH